MASPRFSLSRASPADIPTIAALEYKCFPPIICELFMGCKTEADLPRISDKFAHIMKTDPHDIWVKVVDSVTGGVVAASNWKIYPNGAPSSSDDEAPDWIEPDALEKARRVVRDMNEARRRANPGGFVHLHICFTDPAYRRQGAGGLMMQWGCDVADLLFLPAWIEASPEGNFLYTRYGFYDLENVKGDIEGTNMRRDARKDVIQGRLSRRL